MYPAQWRRDQVCKTLMPPMKRFLWAMAVLATVAVVGIAWLVYKGAQPGARETDTAIEIGRPASVVWPYLEQPERLRTWVGWIVEVEDQTPGQKGLGSKQLWVMEDHANGNQRMRMLNQVTGYKEGSAITFRSSAPGGFWAYNAYTLTDLGGGRSRVTLHTAYTFENAFGRLVSPLVMAAVGKKALEDLTRLRQVIEKG